MDNETIYQTLLEQNKTLGRIEANQNNTSNTVTDLSVRMTTVETYQNKQAGSAHVWAMLRTSAIAIVSAIIGAHINK